MGQIQGFEAVPPFENVGTPTELRLAVTGCPYFFDPALAGRLTIETATAEDGRGWGELRADYR